MILGYCVFILRNCSFSGVYVDLVLEFKEFKLFVLFLFWIVLILLIDFIGGREIYVNFVTLKFF